MKKFLSIIFACVMIFALVGCSNTNNEAYLAKRLSKNTSNLLIAINNLVEVTESDVTINEFNNNFNQINQQNNNGYTTNKVSKISKIKQIFKRNSIANVKDINRQPLQPRFMSNNTQYNSQNSGYKAKYTTNDTNTGSNYLDIFKTKIDSLYNACNDCNYMNNQCNSCASSLKASCEECKTLCEKLQNGEIKLNEDQLKQCNAYCDQINNVCNKIRDCRGDCNNYLQTLRALKTYFGSNSDTLATNYLNLLGCLENRYSHYNEALECVNNCNNLLKSCYVVTPNLNGNDNTNTNNTTNNQSTTDNNADNNANNNTTKPNFTNTNQNTQNNPVSPLPAQYPVNPINNGYNSNNFYNGYGYNNGYYNGMYPYNQTPNNVNTYAGGVRNIDTYYPSNTYNNNTNTVSDENKTILEKENKDLENSLNNLEKNFENNKDYQDFLNRKNTNNDFNNNQNQNDNLNENNTQNNNVDLDNNNNDENLDKEFNQNEYISPNNNLKDERFVEIMPTPKNMPENETNNIKDNNDNEIKDDIIIFDGDEKRIENNEETKPEELENQKEFTTLEKDILIKNNNEIEEKAKENQEILNNELIEEVI